jgi:uncharacterized protein (TIGR02271 family)
MRTQHTTVVGVFEDGQQAQRAVQELRRAGFREDQIGIAARDTGAVTPGPAQEGTYVGEGALAGAATGAGLGALWAIGIAAGALPAIGPVIAGGILASVLASAAGGAAVGSLVGALIGLGIPEEEAEYYESEFHAGRPVVTVRADGRSEEAWAILQRFGAYNRTTPRVTTAATQAGATEATAVGQTMRLHEEQLEAHKRPVETGEVKLRKEVVTEHQTLDVPVQREEVVIERRPATGQTTSGSAIQPGEEIRIPVREEEVDVQKRTVAKEEVSVGKRKVQDTEKVSGTVRKEELRVEREGDVEVRQDAGPKNKGRGKRK